MSSIQELRERLAASGRDAKALLAEKGSQTWSKEEQQKFDTIADECERIKRQIEAHERIIKLDNSATDDFSDVEEFRRPKGKKLSPIMAGYEIWLRKLQKDYTAEDGAAIRNTMSTTTGSQGGYTVQPEVAKTVIDAQKDFGGMRRVADSYTSSTGVDTTYPSSDGTSEIGEIVTQNSPANNLDLAFGTVPLNVVKFGSKIITVPLELLQDTSIDIIALILKRIRQRIGRIQNVKFSQGSGTGEPNGLVTAASVGKTGTTGQTTTIIYDDVVDLVDSLDVAYQDSGAALSFMTTQALRKVLRKIKDTTGRPIWTPNYDAGIAGGFTDELMGYPLNINNDMPTPAANAKSMSFGDHKQYMIRDAMDVTMFRFEDSAFISKGQIGFLAWCRAGGNLLDVNAVKLYQHSAT